MFLRVMTSSESDSYTGTEHRGESLAGDALRYVHFGMTHC